MAEPSHAAPLSSFAAGRTAVVTGAASGIGLAAAQAFAARGLRVILADLPGEALERARSDLEAGGASARAISTDVGDGAAMEALAEAASQDGGPAIVMLNAGIEAGGRIFSDEATWRRILDTNLWGVIHGIRAFGPRLVAGGEPGAVIVTGSKQGITTPPGNTPYNISKAAVKAATEALAHEFRERGAPVSAHLFIPGFVYTGLAQARGITERPQGAWTPQESVAFLLERLAAGDFYILCPDNETTRAQDAKRIAWAAGDIIENRPALSRWHPDWRDRFASFLQDDER